MTFRKTSAEVYRRIRDCGILSRKRLEVYEVFYAHGPLTAAEAATRLPGTKLASVGANIHARIGELVKMGCMEEVGTRTCSITGNEVILWDVNDTMPVKLEKPKRFPCPHCGGRGYTEEAQGILPLVIKPRRDYFKGLE